MKMGGAANLLSETEKGQEVARYSTNGKAILQKFVAHSFRASNIALKHGWLPGARYTNLRDVSNFDRLGFLDIDWKNYNFERHLRAAISTKPMLTIARDIENIKEINRSLDEAHLLKEHSDLVAVVPKAIELIDCLEDIIPTQFIFGYSVPTKYGGTLIPPNNFKRPVHLLGGRPDVQRKLGNEMVVVSLDCNRFTLDAAFGDFFDGTRFRPHPTGGYDNCIECSVININKLWTGY
ncbi:DUF6610 family protein [Methylobacterium sp. Leaf117]|uniref:DUF6610 family protein n=1 Tax=Methylobacterium sp. Leaf117 TaxID=1736260 RepID=UPI000ACFCA90|nr:DUF6610 family protein [Methylobacterium sp. Leaf117]